MAKHTQVAKRAALDTFEMTREPDDPIGPEMAGPKTIAEALAQFELHPLEEPALPPDLRMPPEQLAAIDAGRARQTALQEYVEQRRGILENLGVTVNLVGVEFFELAHRPCGRSWLIPIASGLAAVSTCPYCRRSA
jgi:hypothetical protein